MFLTLEVAWNAQQTLSHQFTNERNREDSHSEALLNLVTAVPASLSTAHTLYSTAFRSQPAESDGAKHNGRLHVPFLPDQSIDAIFLLTPDNHCSDRQLIKAHKNAIWWLTFWPSFLQQYLSMSKFWADHQPYLWASCLMSQPHCYLNIVLYLI